MTNSGNSLCIRSSSGVLCRQGPHQDAQKSNNTGLLLSESRLYVTPSRSFASKAGAIVPVKSGLGRPGKDGTSLESCGGLNVNVSAGMRGVSSTDCTVIEIFVLRVVLNSWRNEASCLSAISCSLSIQDVIMASEVRSAWDSGILRAPTTTQQSCCFPPTSIVSSRTIFGPGSISDTGSPASHPRTGNPNVLSLGPTAVLLYSFLVLSCVHVVDPSEI